MSGRLNQIIKGGVKMPVTCATTANITLSGLQTIDTYVTLEGDRVLVKNQTTTTENGIYVASASAWERATDWNSENDAVNGMLVLDNNDTTVLYRVTFSGTFVLGTTVCTFTDINQTFVTDATAQAVLAAASAAAALVSENNAETAENNAETAETNAAASAAAAAASAAASIAKNGSIAATANLPMGGFKHTGVGDASANTEYASKGQMDTAIAVSAVAVSAAISPMGLEWKTGLLVSNNVADATNDIDIAVGSIMDTTNVYRINLTSAFTKRIDATFAVGTALGGRSDGDSLSNDTWYGIWLLSKSTNTSSCDVIFATTKARSLSDAVATAAGFDLSRLVGYVRRGTATNLAFLYKGKSEFVWDVPISNVTAVSTVGATSTVTVPPSQVGVLGYFIGIQDSDNNVTGFGSLRQVGQTIAAPTAINCDIACEVTISPASNPTSTSTKAIVNVKANTSSQIQHRETGSTVSVDIAAKGWFMDYSVTDLV